MKEGVFKHLAVFIRLIINSVSGVFKHLATLSTLVSHMNFFKHSVFAHVTSGFTRHKKTLIVTVGATLVTSLLLVGGFFGYEFSYAQRIYPNVYVGNIAVGGLSQSEATAELEKRFNKMLDEGLKLTLEGKVEQIDLRNSGATDPDLIYNLISFNADMAAEHAFTARRFPNPFSNLLNKFPVQRVTIDTNITVRQKQLTDSIHSAYPDVETTGVPTAFSIDIGREDFNVEVLEGSEGSLIDTESAFIAIAEDVQDLKLNLTELFVKESDRVVSTDEAEELILEVKAALAKAPYTYTYTSESQRKFSWAISSNGFAKWLIPSRDEDGDPELALDVEAMTEWLNEVREDIDIAPQNARFQVEDGRVKEFKGSLSGIQLNDDLTIKVVLASITDLTEDNEHKVLVDSVHPKITTGSVNDLGIKEIIGVGVSDIAGSPSNRIQNITHGSNKLNGLLIPPGEQLSLVETLKPFTLADGYLPELVIKGDEIKPEIGGGLCQLGTTTFRAVMNSGLQIDQRRNHSLVVGYYNDLSNGNPGTDATLYDPNPDFKFTNDTENYILLTTDIDLDKMLVTYTMWGTSDGREAGYTPPEVLQWRGFGATQYKETTALPPGVQKCQAPHAGAVTSFDYFVNYADGTDFKKTYESTYRSLPRICLVGVDPDAPEKDSEDITDADQTEIDPAEAATPATNAVDELEVTDVSTTEVE